LQDAVLNPIPVMKRPLILSLGSVSADAQARILCWLEVPGGAFELLGGGKRANVACLARRLGAHAALLACAVEDHGSQPDYAALEQANA
jgi:sugar/nucleoside kinase (ribokinase family)